MLILVRRVLVHDMRGGQFELMQIKVQVHDSGEHSLTTTTTTATATKLTATGFMEERSLRSTRLNQLVAGEQIIAGSLCL